MSAYNQGGTPVLSATDKVLGRSSPGGGAAEEIPFTSAARTLVAAASAAAERVILGTKSGCEIVGTTNYYMGCMNTGGTLTTSGTVTANTYRAWPMVFARSGTIDQLAVDVTTLAAGGSVVVALWSDSAGKPGTVLAEATLSSATTGFKTSTLGSPVTVTQGELYWFTVLASANVVLRAPPAGSLIPTFGYPGGSSTAQVGWTVAQAYASPTPAWPVGATIAVSTQFIAVPWYRWSA